MHLIKYDNIWNDSFAEMDRIFDRALGNHRWANLFDQAKPTSGSFRVDVYHEGQDGYHVVAELPGVAKEDVQLRFEDNVLTIEAVRKTKQGDQEKNANYSRSLTVADDIDSEQVTAKLEDGVLTVNLPKAEERKPKSITIN